MGYPNVTSGTSWQDGVCLQAVCLYAGRIAAVAGISDARPDIGEPVCKIVRKAQDIVADAAGMFTPAGVSYSGGKTGPKAYARDEFTGAFRRVTASDSVADPQYGVIEEYSDKLGWWLFEDLFAAFGRMTRLLYTDWSMVYARRFECTVSGTPAGALTTPAATDSEDLAGVFVIDAQGTKDADATRAEQKTCAVTVSRVSAVCPAASLDSGASAKGWVALETDATNGTGNALTAGLLAKLDQVESPAAAAWVI